uniref:Uncharacterized protein n=1 Tax=Solanum lycopersicum TaxID=4081 RepID=A0A3Q7ID57_SOLLC
MGFRIGDSTNVVIACIVSSYGQMEIEMKKLWPSSLLLLQRNDISKVEKPVREYALHDWICQAEIVSFSQVLVDIIHFFSFGNLSGLSAVPQDKTASHATSYPHVSPHLLLAIFKSNSPCQNLKEYHPRAVQDFLENLILSIPRSSFEWRITEFKTVRETT